MAPEQARGREADKRSDIWAFGCVLYEMLTARRAFEGELITDVLASVLKTDPDWKVLAPETPVGLRGLLRRCLDGLVSHESCFISMLTGARSRSPRVGCRERPPAVPDDQERRK